MLVESPYFLYFAAFSITALIQLSYLFFRHARVSAYKNKAVNKTGEPVSVIICARNEDENLRKNLPYILSQKYNNYEVIVVNDGSEDDSDMVLAELKAKHQHLKTTNIPLDQKFSHGKKLAVTVGIKAATHNWLLFTDADCRPASENWITQFASHFTGNTNIVLGYAPFEAKASLLNNYARYDTFFIALQYLGAALAGKPYMGVGRNMAYHKSLFFKNKGFASHYYLQSGDDDLFINETATSQNTAVELSPDSFMYSQSKTRFNQWVKQKKRHFTTYHRYKFKHKLMLGTEVISRLSFYGLFAFLLSTPFNLIAIMSVFGVRFITQFIIFIAAQTKLKERHIWFTSLIFDVFSLFINFGLDLSNKLRRTKKKWH